ncbi:MAG: metallophosphoesterase [Clostridia bacterium]|nr:metallophosphoesterase [Clostridia bacterium]
MKNTYSDRFKRAAVFLLKLFFAVGLYIVINHFVSLKGTLRSFTTFLVLLPPNYYIGLRGWQFVGQYIKILNPKIYWASFWLLAQSYIIGKIINKVFPDTIGDYLLVLDWYWYVAIIYFLMLLVPIDLIRFVDKRLKVLPQNIRGNTGARAGIGAGIFLLVVLVLTYGTWNAQNPKVKNYDLTIQKKAGNLENLNIALVSDMHLGKIVNSGRLRKMVGIINELKPDIVLLAGDTIDDDYKPYLEQGMPEILSGLKSKYGTYAVLGNHEYYNGNMSKNISNLESAGIKVLFDNYVKIDNSFYIVGRDDKGYGRKVRKKMSEFTTGIDGNLPVILMDHWPTDFDEAAKQGVDLQLSGHTHNGQYFPGQLGNKLMHELDYGYMQKGKFQVVVTAGAGTWGVPARIGCDAEIVNINLRFKP